MAENGYAKPVLVTTDWLAENLSRDGVIVAEVDENPDLYDEGHISGAVKLHWREDLQDPIERDLVEKDQFEALMGSRGISNDTTIVVYGDKNNWFAAYAYWYLKIYGHEDVRVLDGGRQKWIDEGRELTTDTPKVSAASYSARDRDESIRAYRDAVRETIGSGGMALVDVRSPQEYSGDLIAPLGYVRSITTCGIRARGLSFSSVRTISAQSSGWIISSEAIPVHAAIGVSTKPGQIAVARTPSSPCSALSDRVSEINAAFAAP